MRIEFNAELFALLENINSTVNCYPYKTNGMADMLKADDLRECKHGVCTDYAYTKMLMLKEAGVNDAGLGIATCLNDSDQLHAVLIASTTDGDYVLDSNSPRVLGFKEASKMYKWQTVPEYLQGKG